MSYVQDMFGLEDKVVVITGGGGVIAGAMTEALVKAGAKVSLWGRGKSHPMEEARQDLAKRTGAPDRLHAVTVDTGTEADVREALAKTEKEFGAPNILVNGVGGTMGKSPFTEIDIELFKKGLDLNLVAGLVIPTKIFAAHWIERGVKGSIINLASMTSYLPLSGVWSYNAAKSAVKNLTEGCAREFAPHGIRVNGIAPGFFLGHQNKALLVKNEATGELTDRGQSIIDHTPFGRFGERSELEGATVFLASDKAAGFITGVTIPVDGGYLVHNI